MNKLMTPAEAKAKLVAEGISIADFARANDLDQATIYQVLAGLRKGRRGMTHRVAVALGIKALPVSSPQCAAHDADKIGALDGLNDQSDMLSADDIELTRKIASGPRP